MVTLFHRPVLCIIAFTIFYLARMASGKRSLREIQVKKEIELLELGRDLPEFTLPDFDFTASSSKWNGSSSGNDTERPLEAYARNVSLPIDYSGKHSGNFSNRYWVVDTYYRPGGPVFCMTILILGFHITNLSIKAFDTGESDGGEAYVSF